MVLVSFEKLYCKLTKSLRDKERQLIDMQINSLLAYAVRDVILLSAVTSGIPFGLYVLHEKDKNINYPSS